MVCQVRHDEPFCPRMGTLLKPHLEQDESTTIILAKYQLFTDQVRSSIVRRRLKPAEIYYINLPAECERSQLKRVHGNARHRFLAHSVLSGSLLN